MLPALVLGALGLSGLVQTGIAEAGRGGGHFSGGGHVSGGARFGGGRAHFSGSAHFGYRGSARFGGRSTFSRGGYRGYRGWGGRVTIRHRSYWPGYYGGGYYPYYYGYYPYYPEYVVPSYYYGTTYYPVQAAPGVSVAEPRPVQPAMPTLGIGVFAGGSSNNNDSGDHGSSDIGALARIRLTPGLLIEGELAKTTFKDNERVDRRIGGSLIYEIGARNAFAPYILAGGGVQQADVDGNFSTTQEYGEVGIGLRWALSRNLHLAFDVRAGRRQAVDSNQPVEISNTARTVAPPSGLNGQADTEDYTRARLAAILSF